MGHTGKVVVDQHELRYVARRFTACRHSYRAVGFFQGEYIVYAVARHSHLMSLFFKGEHKLLFLIRCDSSEHAAALSGFFELFFGSYRAHVYRVHRAFYSDVRGYVHYGAYAVTGYDLERDSLILKVRYCILRACSELIFYQDQSHRAEIIRQC